MSYFDKRAAGYYSTVNDLIEPTGNECCLPYNYNDFLAHNMNEDGPDMDGPKDWIVSYPTSDPKSGQIIGFRCIEDDLPRNSLTQKHENPLTNSSNPMLAESSQRDKASARIETILEQCDYIATMSGMSIREIRERLHEDEQKRLKNSRLENAQSGPVFIFCDPPPLNGIVNTKSRDTGRHMSADGSKYFSTNKMSENCSYYNTPSESERESLSQKCKEIIEEEEALSGKRGFPSISSPTDYAQDESEFINFFSMVKKMHDKCEKVKSEDRQIKTAV